jgi:hypothetical protein
VGSPGGPVPYRVLGRKTEPAARNMWLVALGPEATDLPPARPTSVEKPTAFRRGLGCDEGASDRPPTRRDRPPTDQCVSQLSLKYMA